MVVMGKRITEILLVDSLCDQYRTIISNLRGNDLFDYGIIMHVILIMRIVQSQREQLR